MKKDSVMVICAHNDDQILGVGGTLARYAKEGKDVYVVIFAYGEGSHPWLKDEEITQIRVQECAASDKVLGIKETIYMGYGDSLQKHLNKKRAKEELMKIIKDKKPGKIFVHSRDDPHPDHRAVHQLVIDLITTERLPCEVYTFDIWNPLNIRERSNPRLIVDTTKTFSTKLEALRCHKSQKMAMISLLWNVIRKDFFNGLKNRHRFAEVFYRVH